MTTKQFSFKQFSLGLLLLVFWFAFIVLAAKPITDLVCWGIAGWVMGDWCNKLAGNLIERFNL